MSVRPAPDGMAWLTVLGPMCDVVGAHAALVRAEQMRRVTTGYPDVDARRADDERGRGAWMADTALELLSGRATGTVQPVEVGLLMTPGTLLPRLGHVTGSSVSPPVEVPGWGSIPADAAREHLARLLDGATGEGVPSCETDEAAGEREARVWLRRLFTTPDGRDLVAMDSRRRFFGGALRQLVTLRDPTCRIPWCDAPTREVDHVLAVAAGGQSTADNAMGTCTRHNLDKETPGWRVDVVPRSARARAGPHTVRLRTPTGVTYEAQAPPLRGHGTHPPPVESTYERTLEDLIAAA